jgi:hypothetical protein
VVHRHFGSGSNPPISSPGLIFSARASSSRSLMASTVRLPLSVLTSYDGERPTSPARASWVMPRLRRQ